MGWGFFLFFLQMQTDEGLWDTQSCHPLDMWAAILQGQPRTNCPVTFFAVGLNDHCRTFTTQLLYSKFPPVPPSQLTHHPPTHLSFGCSLLHMPVDASRQHRQPYQHLHWLTSCSGVCPLTPSSNAQSLPTHLLCPSPPHLSHQAHKPPCLEPISTYDSTHNARKLPEASKSPHSRRAVSQFTLAIKGWSLPKSTANLTQESPDAITSQHRLLGRFSSPS